MSTFDNDSSRVGFLTFFAYNQSMGWGPCVCLFLAVCGRATYLFAFEPYVSQSASTVNG